MYVKITSLYKNITSLVCSVCDQKHHALSCVDTLVGMGNQNVSLHIVFDDLYVCDKYPPPPSPAIIIYIYYLRNSEIGE